MAKTGNAALDNFGFYVVGKPTSAHDLRAEICTYSVLTSKKFPFAASLATCSAHYFVTAAGCNPANG